MIVGPVGVRLMGVALLKRNLFLNSDVVEFDSAVRYKCWYAIYPIILSVYVFVSTQFFMSAYLSNYSLLCQPVDYSTSPLALRVC